MKKRVFLIHGWEGNPQNHWFPWLKGELEKRGFEVLSLKMPNPNYPVVSEWISKISDEVGMPDEQTYFVGHSLGSISIIRYLETLQKGSKVGGAVFVAGFINKINAPEIDKFSSLPLDIGKVKNTTNNFVCIFSDNDEYISLKVSNEFAKSLGAKAILEKGKGHFCSGDGVSQLPSVLQSLIEMSS